MAGCLLLDLNRQRTDMLVRRKIIRLPGVASRLNVYNLQSIGGTNARRLAALPRQGLGVDFMTELVSPSEIAGLTWIDSRQKPIRLIDERGL
jgi:hypothetical protein